MKIMITNEEGIGNAILKFPVIDALRDMYPEVKIDTIASERNYELLKDDPRFHKVYLYKYELRIDEPYIMLIDAVFSSNVQRRTVKKYMNLLECPKDKLDFEHKHETQHNLDLIGNGITFKPAILPQFYTEEKRNFIAIHTDCLNTEAWITRHWPIEKWAGLIRKLWQKYKIPFFLFGAEDDCINSLKLLTLFTKVPVINMVGKLHITETARLLSYCKLLISLDSGIMHLASAVGTNSISLWGPTWEVKSHPWTYPKKYAIIRSDIKCGGCYIKDRPRFDKCHDNKCMQGITPDMVIQVIRERKWLP